MRATTTQSTTEPQFGIRFLAGLVEDKQLEPEFVANEERFKTAFESTEQALVYWAPIAELRAEGVFSEFYLDFWWLRRAHPRIKGSVCHGTTGPRKTFPATLTVEAQPRKDVDWLHYATTLLKAFSAETAFLHIQTIREAEEIATTGEGTSNFEIGRSFDAHGKLRLPWGFIWNLPISQQQCVELTELGCQLQLLGPRTLVTLTDNLFDVSTRYSHFDGIRRQAQNILAPHDLTSYKLIVDS